MQLILVANSGREGRGSKSVRVFAGGSASNVIGYITISSTGDAQDFGIYLLVQLRLLDAPSTGVFL